MSRKLTTPDRVMLLMSLIPYLKEHGPTTVRELAEAFGVDAAVLRRLVKFLGVAGVPGETQTYQHEDLFDIDWHALEQHDLVSLVHIVAVDDTPRFSSAETAALIAGLHALTPMLPDSMRHAAHTTATKLGMVEAVDGRKPTVSISEEPPNQRLASITEAINAKTQLTFEYHDAQGHRSVRRVEPVALVQSGESWYLRAHCLDRRADRTFLVDRIRDPQSLSIHSNRSSRTDTIRERIEVSGGELTTTIRVRQYALQKIADFAPRIIRESAPGWLLADVDLLHPEVAVRLVQAAPGDIQVQQPPEARDAVRRWSARAIAAYDA